MEYLISLGFGFIGGTLAILALLALGLLTIRHLDKIDRDIEEDWKNYD